jgi:hypothetical protein
MEYSFYSLSSDPTLQTSNILNSIQLLNGDSFAKVMPGQRIPLWIPHPSRGWAMYQGNLIQYYGLWVDGLVPAGLYWITVPTV